jgi:DNA helicase II / ATP-dependent DNA helicase PcrA
MQTKDFAHFLKTELNEAQRQAVLEKHGPLLVIAGAGSGKTRVITARIASMLHYEHATASSLLALTFTNKAAHEMKERIAHFIGPHKELPFIGTFHSYCLRLLKLNGHLLDTPFVSILDADDQQDLLHSIIQRHNLQKRISAKQLAYQISQVKNSQISPQEQHAQNPLFTDLYHAYEYEKSLSKCFDFDDLLTKAVSLFMKNPEFRNSFQTIIRHVLVDEYQDTNRVQHQLLTLIAQDQSNQFAIDSLCVVGDEDQSIYSWRGATIANIIHFKKDFPHTTIMTIEQNYRSVQPILQAANAVIAHNKERNPKQLWSARPGYDRIRGISCLSEYHEAEVIAQLIKTAQKSTLPVSIALLYRTHFQSRALEEACIKHALAYTIIGGVQFYERKEIKDLLAYLKLVLNPFDRTSFFRIINCPARGLGQKFEQECHERWQKDPFLTGMQLVQALLNEGTLTSTKKESLRQFHTIFEGLNPQTQPSYALEQVIQKTRYNAYLDEQYDSQEAQTRKENIQELLNAFLHFEQTGKQTLESVLDEIALMQAHNSSDTDHPAVVLMTLHSAKGLEFDIVILAGFEDGLLPSSRSFYDRDALEEERRLLYVGITRAKEYLLLTHARYRSIYGTTQDQKVSQFAKEIPEQFITWNDGTYWNPAYLVHYFSEWVLPGHPTTPSVSLVNGNAKKNNLHPIPSANVKAVQSHTAVWKKNQPVAHTTFGTGIIQEIEMRNNGTTYLTVQFKRGTKKIDASFITSL